MTNFNQLINGSCEEYLAEYQASLEYENAMQGFQEEQENEAYEAAKLLQDKNKVTVLQLRYLTYAKINFKITVVMPTTKKEAITVIGRIKRAIESGMVKRRVSANIK